MEITIELVNKIVFLALGLVSSGAVIQTNKLPDNGSLVGWGQLAIKACCFLAYTMVLPFFSIKKHFISLFLLSFLLVSVGFIAIGKAGFQSGPHEAQLNRTLFWIASCVLPIAAHCWINCLYEAIRIKLADDGKTDYKKVVKQYQNEITEHKT